MTRPLDMRVAGRHPAVTSQPKTDFFRAERPKELSPPPVALRGRLLRLWWDISSNHEGFLKCYFMCLLARSLFITFFFFPIRRPCPENREGQGNKRNTATKVHFRSFSLSSYQGLEKCHRVGKGMSWKMSSTLTLRPCNIVYNSLFNRLFQLNMNAKHTEGQQEEWEGEQAEKLNTKIQFSAPHLHFCTLEYNTSYFIW